MMGEHECVVGLLNISSESELATVAMLKDHIADRIRRNSYLREMGLPFSDWLYDKEWSLKDYCDKRRSTNLTRFDYCPECGKKIDWKRIKEADGND
jgi:hypothetical protein